MAQNSQERTVVIVGGGLTAGAGGAAARRQGHRRAGARARRRPRAARPPSDDSHPARRAALGDAQRPAPGLGAARPTRCATRASETALPARRLEAFLPGEGMGGAANHWNGQTWRWAEYDPVLRTRLENALRQEGDPGRAADAGLGRRPTPSSSPTTTCSRSSSASPARRATSSGKIQPGGNPFEAPRKSEYPQAPLEITEAGLIFKAAAEKLGYKPFPMPAANSPQRLHQSRRHEARRSASTAATASASSARPTPRRARRCCSIRCCCRQHRTSRCGCART